MVKRYAQATQPQTESCGGLRLAASRFRPACSQARAPGAAWCYRRLRRSRKKSSSSCPGLRSLHFQRCRQKAGDHGGPWASGRVCGSRLCLRWVVLPVRVIRATLALGPLLALAACFPASSDVLKTSYLARIGRLLFDNLRVSLMNSLAPLGCWKPKKQKE